MSFGAFCFESLSCGAFCSMHNLYQTVMQKVSINIFLSIQISWDKNRRFQNNLSQMTYVNTRNINIAVTQTRLVPIHLAWRCDNTVDKKRMTSCVLRMTSCVPKHLFEGSSATKKSPKPTQNALSDALLMSRFQNFTSLMNEIINSLIHEWIRGQTFEEVVFFTRKSWASDVMKVSLKARIRPPQVV